MHLVRLQRLGLAIVRSIVHKRLDDFGAFARLLVSRAGGDAS